MTREGLIEVMARGIYERNPASVSEGAVCWAEALEDWPEHVREARKDATAALAAIEAAGVRLVPVEATQEMYVAGQRANAGPRSTVHGYIYEAMLAASPYAPAQKDESHE